MAYNSPVGPSVVQVRPRRPSAVAVCTASPATSADSPPSTAREFREDRFLSTAAAAAAVAVADASLVVAAGVGGAAAGAAAVASSKDSLVESSDTH